jgi:hypothetical protein
LEHVEPSYVIRKFLDAARIHNLTTYLEALHEKGRANADHTTLLLNCYTKLKEEAKLKAFIRGSEDASKMLSKDEDGNSESRLKFDVETAINVLRSAGCISDASYLALNHKEHDLYLKIQLDNIHDYTNALEYISKLEFAEAEKYLKKYGKQLVTALPEKATLLLMSLCTDYKPKKEGVDDGPLKSPRKKFNEAGGGGGVKSNPEDFIHCYVNHTKFLKVFLQYVTIFDKNSSVSTLVWDTLLELHLRSDTPDMMSLRLTVEGNMEVCDDKANYEENIMKLLKDSRAKYNDTHAQVLVQMLNFKPGQLYLYDKLHMYHMVVQHYMEIDDKLRLVVLSILCDLNLISFVSFK